MIDAGALYEATIFAADNNALEVRSLHRSGPTDIKEVEAAREAFFTQETFTRRGIWDKNLFDNNSYLTFQWGDIRRFLENKRTRVIGE